MTDERIIADMLGAAPAGPDPRFRVDVLSRISRRKARRAALRLAGARVLVFSAIGAAVPITQAAGLTFADLQPLLILAGVLGLAYLSAMVSIQGPRAVLARSRAALLSG